MPAAPRPKPRPYREFLTPALHRKFVSASLAALVICYGEACFLGGSGWFWRWFPIGPAGLRTLLLFISTLLVFLVRIQQLHVGARTTKSPLQTFWMQLFSAGTFWTIFCYLSSAFLFCEVYLWSVSPQANLGLVEQVRSNERKRMNERAVFIRTQFHFLAWIQIIYHLASNYDQVKLPFHKWSSSRSSKSTSFDLNSLYSPEYVEIVRRSVFKAAASSVIGTFAYLFLFRGLVWDFWFSIVRYGHFLPKNSSPRGLLPYGLPDLVLRFFFRSAWLILLWESSNHAFSVFISKEPLKKEKPLTDDSKDPNGSLLYGLRSKMQFAKTIAFWELVLISERFPNRRLAIYQDIDRPGGSTWSQYLAVCLAEIQAIQSRIQAFQSPNAPATDDQDVKVEPRIPITAPLKTGPVLSPSPAPRSRRDKAAAAVEKFAKSHGSHPGAQSPLTGPSAKKLLEYSSSKMLTSDQRAKLQPAAVKAEAEGYLMTFLRTWAAYPLRQPFCRQVTAVVCGSPYSQANIIVDSIDAVTKLATQSIKEDLPGQVQKDVPALIRTLADILELIEAFLLTTPPHWTDVFFKEADRRSAPEVEAILEALRRGLENLVRTFGEYSVSLGISESEIKVVKDLIASNQTTTAKNGDLRTDMAEVK